MKITIVGGGTAGWLAAAFLKNKIARSEITVIDKELANPIGVGEATILDFLPFMDECGFTINEWLPATDATFKTGILFTNWKKPLTEIWHPFYTNVTYPGLSSWDVWAQDQSKPFLKYGVPAYTTAKENKIDLNQHQLYAYHLDCSKLVDFIQQKLQHSVVTIRSSVIDVVKTGNKIDKLVLNNGAEHYSDLYIDCTGFLSLLKKQTRVDLSSRLFCDTAIAGHVPYNDKETEQKSYAIADAVDHGWIWQIPVQSRLGTGLVFNRSITDIDTAKDYLVTYWNNRIDRDKLRVIDWSPYYIENFWEENVVSIGLSSGFIEPLESTGLSLIRIGIKRFAEKIKLGYYTKFDCDLYNQQMIRYFEDTVDFVNMHYSDTERTGTFWEFVKSTHTKSDSQLFFEEYLKNPVRLFLEISESGLVDHKIFNPTNWLLILLQLGYPVNKQIYNLPFFDIDFLRESFVRNEEVRIKRSIPHQDVLDFIKLQGMNIR